MESVPQLTIEERVENLEKSQDSIVQMVKDFYREARPTIVGQIAATNEVLKSIPIPQPPYWIPSDEDGKFVLKHEDYTFSYDPGNVYFDGKFIGNGVSLEAAAEIVEKHKKDALEEREGTPGQ